MAKRPKLTAKHKARIRESNLKRWADPKIRKAMLLAFKKGRDNPTYREELSIRNKRLWRKKSHLQKMAKIFASKSFKKKRSKASLRMWRSCKFRQKRKLISSNPEFKAKISGANSKSWKGGRYKTHHGYICMMINTKYVLEHRAIMEQKIGRSLKSYETVHHKNGFRDDNRIDNLELWTKRHGAGIRSSDVKHCASCTCMINE